MPPQQFRRGDHVELAASLLEDIGGEHFKDTVVYDEGGLYRYDHGLGLWAPVTDDEASRTLMGFAGIPCQGAHKVSPLRVNAPDIKGAINIAKDRAGHRKKFFAQAPIGLSFRNGFVSVSKEHGIKRSRKTAENRMRTGFAYDYDPNAKSEAFLSLVDSMFRDDPDKADKIAFVQELFGISLVRGATSYHKSALFIGDGENGKDTLIDVLQSVFPPEATSAVGPHKWKDAYYRARLVDIWLNVIGELPETDLDASEAFKAIITGSEIDARQPYGRVFNFRPIAGHVFACNGAMGTQDFSHGFFRRFVVIRFNRTFSGAERDPKIKEKMAPELPAIIAWLLEGAARLMKNGEYTIPASHFAELKVWRRNADQVATFIEAKARPIVDGEKGKTGDGLYQSYAIWAKENGHAPMSSTKFGTRVTAVLRELGFPEKRVIKGVVTYPVILKPRSDGSVGMREVGTDYPLPKNSNNVIRLR